jgi:acyl carrier protein
MLETAASDVLQGLRELIRAEARLPLATLDPETTLQDLGLDSLARVRVLVAIERKYGIDVDEKRAARITKVADFIELIENR